MTNTWDGDWAGACEYPNLVEIVGDPDLGAPGTRKGLVGSDLVQIRAGATSFRRANDRVQVGGLQVRRATTEAAVHTKGPLSTACRWPKVGAVRGLMGLWC
jgi:hypothetical protein